MDDPQKGFDARTSDGTCKGPDRQVLQATSSPRGGPAACERICSGEYTTGRQGSTETAVFARVVTGEPSPSFVLRERGGSDITQRDGVPASFLYDTRVTRLHFSLDNRGGFRVREGKRSEASVSLFD